MRKVEDLVVWNESIDLVVICYKVLSSFPKSEQFGLISQIKRCSSSIPANIAEGFGRYSKNELKRFCLISMGSLKELQTHMIIAEKLSMISQSDYNLTLNKSKKVEALLAGLIRSLKP